MTMMGKNTRFFWVILLDKKQMSCRRLSSRICSSVEGMWSGPTSSRYLRTQLRMVSGLIPYLRAKTPILMPASASPTILSRVSWNALLVRISSASPMNKCNKISGEDSNLIKGPSTNDVVFLQFPSVTPFHSKSVHIQIGKLILDFALI